MKKLKKRDKIFVHVCFSPNERRKVGSLYQSEGKNYFKYDTDYLKSGFNLSPLKLRFTDEIQVCPYVPFNGLFGVFADSLPDGWGRLIMDRHLLSLEQQPDLITPLDRLSLIGEAGMGALDYLPDNKISKDKIEKINLSDYAEQSIQILKGFEGKISDDFYRLTGTSGGARPKIEVIFNPIKDQLKTNQQNREDDDEDWIIKFPSIHDLPDVAQIEYSYYLMAKEAGIEMANSKLFDSKNNQQFFGTKRFDREKDMRYHLHSAAGLMHDDFRKSTLDYGHLMDAAIRLENNKNAAKKVFRLALFNVLTANQDDHSKNFSFLMNSKGQWQFSPAYDLTYSPNAYGFQTTAVSGQNKDISASHFLQLASHFSIEEPSKVISQVKEVVAEWKHFAELVKVSGDSKKRISLIIQEKLESFR